MINVYMRGTLHHSAKMAYSRLANDDKSSTVEDRVSVDLENDQQTSSTTLGQFRCRLLHIIAFSTYTILFISAYAWLPRTVYSDGECIRRSSSWCKFPFPLLSPTHNWPRLLIAQCFFQIAPALAAIKYLDTRFDGRVFGADSVYKGPPLPELETAWDRISQVSPFALSESSVEKIGKKQEGIVKVGEERYLGNLEVYHQLHCLVSLLQGRIFQDTDTSTQFL